MSGCPDPAFVTYRRVGDSTAVNVPCRTRLTVRGLSVRVHVYGCTADGNRGATMRQSEEEGLLQGMILQADASDSECAAVVPDSAPCLYDLDTENPGTQMVSFWRMKVIFLRGAGGKGGGGGRAGGVELPKIEGKCLNEFRFYISVSLGTVCKPTVAQKMNADL